MTQKFTKEIENHKRKRKPQKNRQENSEKEWQAEEISTYIKLYHKAAIIKAVCSFSNGLMKQ